MRFFLLEGTERALLIYSGMQVQNAREIAEGLTALPVSLLITHGDRDHVGSNEEFPVFYMHPAEASNYYKTQGKTGIEMFGRRILRYDVGVASFLGEVEEKEVAYFRET